MEKDLTEEQIEQVINADKPEEIDEDDRETYVKKVLIQKLRELQKSDIGVVREYSVPIPAKELKTDPFLKRYVKLLGEIGRNPDYDIETKMEQETVGNHKLLLVILYITNESDIDQLEKDILE